MRQRTLTIFYRVNEHYITPAQLCVGVYIELDLGWMEHPFTFNSFRIKSEEQLALLQRLALTRVRYDPKKSTAQPLAVNTAAPPAPAAEPSQPDPQLAEMRQRKLESIEHLRGIRADIEKMERRFARAADSVRSITRQLQTRPEEAVNEANAVVSQMVEVLLADGEMVLHVLGDSLGEEVYFHSLNVSVLSLLLCKAAGIDGYLVHQVGIGALLHDIGKAEIPYKVVSKVEPLTRSEQSLMRMHCDYGVKLADRMGLSAEATAIVMQHHEFLDGSGYPRGLRGEEIALAARVVSIANEYDNLCNPPNVNQALTPSEALSHLFSAQRTRFDERLLSLFIKRLGVYPPGSLVQLSNDMMGLVISLNEGHTLRPNVLVYDASVPKEEALILNLEREPDIKIVRSLRPAQLPRRVHQYLNPRKNVTYFIDTKSRDNAT